MAALAAEHVHVEFPIYGPQRSFRNALFDRAAGGIVRRDGKRQDHVIINALQDINFELSNGDRLGLIGHNGAGKSTLLKVLAGIYEPVRGRILLDGEVTPLFDALPGLDPDDTGYENVITAGLLLGMTRDQVENKISAIEEFSELGEYLSLPVRTYSSGMITRLGFAVATGLEPDILLMDEGIATGDARFAERATKRMREFISRSSIMVLASHSIQMVQDTCNKALLLQSGRVAAFGPTAIILEHYDAFVQGKAPTVAV